MKIILPIIPDPPSVVMQGEQFGSGSDVRHCLLDAAVPQGMIGTAVMPELPVPRLTNLRTENYGTPSKIGPKVFSGGELVMLDYGAQPVKVFVDATQSWLNSQVATDRVGQISTLLPRLMEMPEAIELAGNDIPAGWQPLAEVTRTQLAPEVERSGLVKRVTAANVPDLYGWKFNDMFTEMPAAYYLSGITRTGAGAVLGSCSVYAVGFSGLGFNPDPGANPFAGSAISDAVSGAYSIQVKPGVGYWAMAYQDGPPEVTGTTAHAVTAGSYDIYLRDPTTASSGGGAVFRPIGSPVVRGIQL